MTDKDDKPHVSIFRVPPLSESDQDRACEAFKTPQEAQDLVIRLAEGNIGAFRVCSDLATRERHALLAKLDELGLRGPSIWISYKDLGGETYEGMEEVVFADDIRSRLAALGY